ncbi:TlpA disulfide reductase family protein [uncultured Microscilla sp.]|uniref:TlpA disulfide reductase family protein n=1 Tax=uncultured Microscilla sp. TaxID=432653 RepID=UPI0026088FDA|nr:TlpA disulfide reductase family protein [uncultured Microscilla sp.]
MKFLNLLHKHHYLWLAGVLLLVGCQGSGNKDEKEEQTNVTKSADKEGTRALTINGSVKSPPKNGVVVLEKLVNRKYAPVDSTQLNNGKFVFEVKISEPEFYRLLMFKKQQIYMLLTDKDLEVVADATVPEIPYTVKGSQDMAYYREANRLVNKLGQQQNALASKYVLAKKSQKAEADELYKQLIELQKKGIAQVKGMIDTIQPSIAALYASNILNPDEEHAYLTELVTKLRKNYPKSRYVKRLAEYLKSIEKWTVGKPAPEISLPSPAGKVIKLSDLKGKLVLIDFWASWCKPCRKENPHVVKVYNEYKNRGFEVFGVSLDRNKKDWVKAIKADGLEWLHVSDLKMWNSEAAQTYNVRAIPKTFLIDKQGNILAKDLRGEALKERIAKELN